MKPKDSKLLLLSQSQDIGKGVVASLSTTAALSLLRSLPKVLLFPNDGAPRKYRDSTQSPFFFLMFNIFIDYAITVVPFPPPTPLHPAHPLPPTFPAIVHVHGSYI